jgi:hypothetical protein
MSLERIPYDPVAWESTLAAYPDAEVFHSPAWLAFLEATQHAEIVVAVVSDRGRPVGHFVGAIVRRFGVRILGSPLRGWGTQVMGFLLDEGADRVAAAGALLPFAFRELGCLHVELADRLLSTEAMAGSGYITTAHRTYVVDLGQPEEEIFRRLHSKTRQYVRQAQRNGLRAEVATDLEFADEFHTHLTEVFERQGLVPTYGVERVRQLIEFLQPSGQLLLLRIRGADGATLATGLAIGRNRVAINWGAALPRAHAAQHPIQLFWWEAMRYWRDRGALTYDMGGDGEYKERYGSVERPAPSFHRSRFAIMGLGRSAVRNMMAVRQGLGRRRPPAAPVATTDRDDGR